MSTVAVYQLFKEAAILFWYCKGPRLGAALAYYSALSLAPLLLVVMAVVAFIYGDDAAREELTHRIRDTVGNTSADAIQSLLAHHTRSSGVIATTIGVITTLIGASGLFANLQEAIDTLWRSNANEQGVGVRAFIIDQLLAFGLVGGVALLLVVTVALQVFLFTLIKYTSGCYAETAAWLHPANQLISFLVTVFTFMMVFTVLPHSRPKISHIWVGAAMTAILFTIGKYLIGIYLDQASVGSAYGVAGSFVAFLVWIYYSAQILLFGAAFIHVLSTSIDTFSELPV